MSESEVISIGQDRNVGGLPRKMRNRDGNTKPKGPSLWNARETFESEGVWGAYPRGFIAWACRTLNCKAPEVLHVCSGGLPEGQGRYRVDLRRSMSPSVVADGRSLPFADNSFAAVMIDPPYAQEYARDLYGTEYPRPSHLLAEAARVLRPCGRVGMLHFLVPSPPPNTGLKIVKIHGVTTGCGFRIRAWTVFELAQDELTFTTEKGAA